MRALVIHPRLSIWAGGEYICMVLYQTLQHIGYTVYLAADVFEPDKAEEFYGMGDVMKKCKWVQLPEFHSPFPRLLSFQRVFHSRMVKRTLGNVDADIVFSTQASMYL